MVSDKEKLELALSIMNDKMVEQYQEGVILMESGFSIEDMPENIFID